MSRVRKAGCGARGKWLFRLPARSAATVPGGGWLSSPPADPAFSLLSCPLSPFPPSPGGEGGILSFLMQGAPPLASPGAETGRHLQPFPSRTPGGGWLSSPPANPAFSLLSCPLSPCPPFPRREGGILGFLMQGAPPLAFPGAESGRHLQPFPSRTSGGGWLSSPPADPAFSLLSCPLSPCPFPAGRGGFLVFLCKGLRPLHPRGLNPGGTYSPCHAGHPAGDGFLPRLPTLPLACFAAPIPLPFPGGKGRFLVFLCKGLRPLHPRELNPGGTYQSCHAGHPTGAGFLPRLPTLPLACFLAPIPLPLPGGKGRFLVFLCKGLRPLHPRELNPGGTYSPYHVGHPAGMAFGFLPTTEDTDARQPSATPTRINATPPSANKYILMKVLGGLGASFKKPPTFPRFPVSPFPSR